MLPFGADDGNRTHTIALGRQSSTTKLHPLIYNIVIISRSYIYVKNFFIISVRALIGRPMNANTDTHILLCMIQSGNTDFHFAIHIPDHNFQLSIFNFQLNCVYQCTIILIQNYIRIKTFSLTQQAFFRLLYIRL